MRYRAGRPQSSGRNCTVWFADLEGPEHHVAALGTRPAFIDEQRRYDRVARNIDDAYRDRFGVDGSDPLGPRPLESFPRLAYDKIAAQIRAYEKVRWREIHAAVPRYRRQEHRGS